MKALAVLYATREGQTRRIAERIAATLRTRDFRVDVVDVGCAPPADFALARYAAAVVAASIHIGKHEPEMIAFVKRHRADLERIPTLFLSVSLSQAGADDANATDRRRQSAAANVETMIVRFLRRTGWKPTRVHPVAGALLYRQYGIVVRFAMRFISTLVGASTDTSRDHEYTDWRAVERFADEFALLVGQEPGSAESPTTAAAATGRA